jgi:hypothetical protein
MAAIAILAGIAVFCWLLYGAAIFALPLFLGLTIFFHATQTGAGTLGAIVLGFGTGVLVLAVARTLFTLPRSPFLRIGIALIFVIPAAVAGYFTTFGLFGLAAVSADWRQAFAILSAMAVGATAWLRLTAMPLPVDAGEQRRQLQRRGRGARHHMLDSRRSLTRSF